jgi:hypothetical protein
VSALEWHGVAPFKACSEAKRGDKQRVLPHWCQAGAHPGAARIAALSLFPRVHCVHKEETWRCHICVGGVPRRLAKHLHHATCQQEENSARVRTNSFSKLCRTDDAVAAGSSLQRGPHLLLREPALPSSLQNSRNVCHQASDSNSARRLQRLLPGGERKRSRFIAQVITSFPQRVSAKCGNGLPRKKLSNSTRYSAGAPQSRSRSRPRPLLRLLTHASEEFDSCRAILPSVRRSQLRPRFSLAAWASSRCPRSRSRPPLSPQPPRFSRSHS